jgi:hypothetical protein
MLGNMDRWLFNHKHQVLVLLNKRRDIKLLVICEIGELKHQLTLDGVRKFARNRLYMPYVS